MGRVLTSDRLGRNAALQVDHYDRLPSLASFTVWRPGCPLNIDSNRPLGANSSHSPTAWRTAKLVRTGDCIVQE
jgi:hypothetical protein